MEQGKHSVQSRWAATMARGKMRTESFGGGKRNYDSRSLDGQAVLLLVVQGLLGIANALSGTFVPVYLWKASQSLALIGWFNLFQATVSGLTFWLAGKWVKEHNKMHCLRLGVALSGAFYLTVLLIGKSAVDYAIPLGVLNGIALGLFWLAYNVVYFEVTEPGNRDRFNGLAGFLGSGAGILAPWISGLIITSQSGERGYTIIFTISVILFAVAVVMSFWLKKREAVGQYEWLYGFRQLTRKDSPWRRVVPAIMAQGVREGVFMFLINLLVYISTNNEQKVGNFSLITSFVALISFWLIGRLLTPQRRKAAMLIGAVMVTAVIVPLFWPLRYGTLLMFGIGSAIFMPLYIIPMTSTVFDMIGQSEESASRREEFIVLREAGLTLGRVIGLSSYLLVLPITKGTPEAVPILLLAVGMFPIIGWLFIRPYLSKVKRPA
ncbi:MFS transporter [Paenibacillus methanolicus]|uniref:YQGE family putative transporter n=1 Tax=Paenibacillus methanolicus TaxID=582686 RepID=A0A5S5BUE0_9BACL|nr:MFS transporter [Paenibacillus methanolicus]TYP69770.1 YQGE family putative transporter [Paenibacillus methanolicus]